MFSLIGNCGSVFVKTELKKNKKVSTMRERLEEANKLIFVRCYVEAKAILEKILRQHRTNFLIHMRYIELAVKLNEIEEVKKSLRSHHSVQVRETCAAMISQLSEEHAPLLSISQYQELIKKYGESACAYYGIGYNLEKMGDYDRAITNYEKSLLLDPEWYPSYFGLSQIYYQKKFWQEGDQFFYLFEQIAPYDVYGNFETHRKLSQDFFQQKRYDEAQEAINCLVEWWLESQHTCPPEVLLYKYLHQVKVEQARGNEEQATSTNKQAVEHLNAILDSDKISNESLLFVVRACKEFDLDEYVYDIYIQLIESGKNKHLMREINDYYYSKGKIELAVKIFEYAYACDPNDETVKLRLLVSRLQLHEVNVEDYLSDREKLKQMIMAGSDRLELLNLLHAMLIKFDGDPEVYQELGTLYDDMNATDKAEFYFRKMHYLDSDSSSVLLTYAAFFLKHKKNEQGYTLLQNITADRLSTEQKTKFFTLQAKYYADQHDFNQADKFIKQAVRINPWQVPCLISEIFYLTNICYKQKKIKAMDRNIVNLYENLDFDQNNFWMTTKILARDKLYYLAYVRAKLYFLYQKTSESLQDLIIIACMFDPNWAIQDFSKLLNTNYDSPLVLYALGIFSKECWQHETACMWFDLALRRADLSPALQGDIYLELADCYVWRDQDLDTAVEYAHSAMKGSISRNERAARVLGHAYLKRGDLQMAEGYLRHIVNMADDDEVGYLMGLLEYRRGSDNMAFELWEVILRKESENLRLHHIKQEVLKFYTPKSHHLKVS